jgi:hypothetical protein
MDGAGEGASNKFLIEGRGKSLGQLTEPKRVQLRATASHSHRSMPVSTSSPLLGLARNVEISITYPLYIIGENSLQRILHKGVAGAGRPPSLLAQGEVSGMDQGSDFECEFRARRIRLRGSHWGPSSNQNAKLENVLASGVPSCISQGTFFLTKKPQLGG